MTPKASDIWRELERIQSSGYDTSTVFSDFLDTILYTLLSFNYSIRQGHLKDLFDNKAQNEYEVEYMKLIKKYKENETRAVGDRPIDYYAKAWTQLMSVTKLTKEDVLGDLFMEYITRGEHGQYFTPMHMCDMMAQMVMGENKETVQDPACGSGRLLLAAAKINPDIHCSGIDVSLMCCKIAAINMWLFDVNADIYQGDSLTMKMHQVWKIRKGGWLSNHAIAE